VAAPTKVIDIVLRTHREGEEAYAEETTAQALLRKETDSSTQAMGRQERASYSSLRATKSLASGSLHLASALLILSGANDSITNAFRVGVAVTQTLLGVWQVATAVSRAFTAAQWAQAASHVATYGPGALAVAAIVAAAAIAVYALSTRGMRFGGAGEVTGPATFFVEPGVREGYGFWPGGLPPSTGGASTVQNTFYIQGSDPGAIARAVADALVRQKQGAA